MRTYFILIFSLLITSFSFAQSDCIDTEIIDQDTFCPGIYDPVCGCDGVTYSNDCVATYYHGVTSWTDGECSGVEPCTDLAEVDFGECEMLLGYGIVNGECQPISGCGTVASDEIDYSNAIHGSPGECEEFCGSGGVDECTDLAGIDFGLCAAVLGYGLVNGECQAISGCSTVGDDEVDYADALHDSPEDCEATCGSGGVDECTDLAGVDFGDCELLLGYGLVNGQCQAISGCSTVGDDEIDYADAIHDSPEACENICGSGVDECTDLAGIDFGECEVVLGYGLVNGECQAISGCSTVGDDEIDYADAIHSTPSACQVLCGDASGCVDLSEVDFGACAMPLGIIWNGSYCEAISGCDYIGDDGVDYSNYFYQNIEDCAGCASECYNPDQVNDEYPCTEEYNPVCGCDSVTYSNECYAYYIGGVTSWTAGECNEVEPCTDLAGVDFGECEMLLGYGLVNGECQTISGCSTVGDDEIDYADAIHSTPSACQVLCGDASGCVDLSEVDFGACDMPLGIIWNGSYCESISGCDYIGDDGVDYSDYFYQDIEDCAGCATECFNPDQLDADYGCFNDYDPVCGCDSVTYSNYCYAYYLGGVTSWTDGECGTVGVGEDQKSVILVYPTVFDRQLKIKGELARKSKITVYSGVGRVVFEKVLEPGTTEIQMPGLADGMYYFTISKDGKGLTSGKLIKSRQ